MEQGHESCNHQNPSRFERIKHALGIFTCDASGAENASSPAEARMIRKFHEVGGAGFTILRSAEAPILQTPPGLKASRPTYPEEQ